FTFCIFFLMIKSKRILIVEDDPVIATDIKKFLLSKNYTVISVVRQAYRAVEEAEKEIPDAVIMDIMLEGYMNGIDAAEKISNGLNIPVIFLTALNDDETFLLAADTKP